MENSLPINKQAPCQKGTRRNYLTLRFKYLQPQTSQNVKNKQNKMITKHRTPGECPSDVQKVLVSSKKV